MKITFLAILIVGLFTLGQAQKVEPQPLKLTLSIKEKNLCVGKTFTILARMENVGDKNQIIDERNLWRYVRARGPFEEPKTTVKNDASDSGDFAKLLRIPRFMVVMGDNFADDDVPKEYLKTLKPQKVYKDRSTVTAESYNKFFRVSGEYTFQTGYGQYADWSAKGVSLFIGHVESNELKFTLSDCKKSAS